MAFPIEHVQTWLNGFVFRKKLDAFDTLLFDLNTMIPEAKESKAAFQEALDAFRVHHFNKFIHDLQSNLIEKSERIIKFLKCMKLFEKVEKPKKQDYIDLFRDMISFWNLPWPGGLYGDVPVLRHWRSSPLDMKPIYKHWNGSGMDVHPHVSALHGTCERMFKEFAEYVSKPDTGKGVLEPNQDIKLYEENRHLEARCAQLEQQVRDAQHHEKTLNDMFHECRVSLQNAQADLGHQYDMLKQNEAHMKKLHDDNLRLIQKNRYLEARAARTMHALAYAGPPQVAPPQYVGGHPPRGYRPPYGP